MKKVGLKYVLKHQNRTLTNITSNIIMNKQDNNKQTR